MTPVIVVRTATEYLAPRRADRLKQMSARPAQRPGQRPADRYGDPKFRRTGLAPGLLAAVVILAGLALLDIPAFIVIRYVVAILALIVGFFAIQAKQWWWIPLLAAIAVIWNPAFPLPFHGQWWVAGQYVAVAVFVVVGVLIKVPIKPEEKKR